MKCSTPRYVVIVFLVSLSNSYNQVSFSVGAPGYESLINQIVVTTAVIVNSRYILTKHSKHSTITCQLETSEDGVMPERLFYVNGEEIVETDARTSLLRLFEHIG